MEATTLNTITAGAPGVMLVVSAADLKNVVNAMWQEQDQRTADALAAQRERPTLTRFEAAKALNVTLTTLWRWAKIGYLTPVKIGTKVLYKASDIDRMLQEKGKAV